MDRQTDRPTNLHIEAPFRSLVTNFFTIGTIDIYDIMIPSNSAVSNNIKFASYRQEVKWVKKNTALHISWSIKMKHLSCLRMQLAGYGEGFWSQILADEVKGYLKKVQYSVKNKTPLDRPRGTIMAEKVNKKNWPITPVQISSRKDFLLFLLLRDPYWPNK